MRDRWPHVLVVGGLLSVVLVLAGLARGGDSAPLEAALAGALVLLVVAHVLFLSGGPEAWRVARAYVVRTFQVLVSYKFQVAMMLAQVAVLAALLVILGRPLVRLIFGPVGTALEGYTQTNFVLYAMLGLSLWPTLWTSFQVSASRLRQEQMTGLFEALVPTPAGIRALPFASFFASVTSSILSLAALLVVFHFLVPPGALRVTDPRALVAFVAVILPSIVTMWGLGLMVGGLTALFKAADAVTSIVRVLLLVFGGLYFPLALLPEWGQTLALALPVTRAGEGARLALAEGVRVSQFIPMLAVVVAWALVASTVGMWVYGRLVDRARRAGTLSGY